MLGEQQRPACRGTQGGHQAGRPAESYCSEQIHQDYCHKPECMLDDGRRLEAWPEDADHPSEEERIQWSALDRIEVGRVGRQEPDVGTAGLDHCADAGALVLAQVIQPHDLTRLECRGQHVLDVRLESAGGHRLVEDEPRSRPCQSERGDGRPIRPVIPGSARVGPLAARCPGVGPGQAGVTAELVDPDPASWLDRRGELPPGLAGRLVAFAGAAGLVFRVQPRSRMITRLIVESETCTPWVSAQRAQCSARVSAGCAWSWASNPTRRGPILWADGPGRGDSARLAVSRRRWSQRLMVRSETRNWSATSARGTSRSTASMTRIRGPWNRLAYFRYAGKGHLSGETPNGCNRKCPSAVLDLLPEQLTSLVTLQPGWTGADWDAASGPPAG
jgi:hypothetical protein